MTFKIPNRKHQNSSIKEDGWIRRVNCLYKDRLDVLKLKYPQIGFLFNYWK